MLLLKIHKLMKKIFTLSLTSFLLHYAIILNAQTKEVEVVILHTNDMHAAIDMFPKLDVVVTDFRKTYKNLLLVSAGDLFSGNPFVDKHQDPGSPMIELMNILKYDISALGNHEFDYGQKTLNKRFNQATFPFVCANYRVENAELKKIDDYKIFQFEDSIDIAFLGLIETQNDGLPSTHPLKTKGLDFVDALDKATEFTFLEAESECTIALSHLGIETDTILARLYPQFDIIIGGHSHTVIDSQYVVNESIIAQTGSRLKNLGVIKIKFVNREITKIENYLINLEEIELSEYSEIITEKLKEYKDNEFLNSVVGKAKMDINDYDQLGSFFTDALVSYTKADVAFQNNGGIRVTNIPKGDIYAHQVFAMDPFGNNVVVVEMSALQIKGLIKYSYNQKKQLELQTSGITYKIETDSKSEITDVILFDKNKKKIKDTDIFNVAINTYILESYSFVFNKIVNNYDVTSAEMILEYLKTQTEIDYSDEKRIFINTKK